MAKPILVVRIQDYPDIDDKTALLGKLSEFKKDIKSSLSDEYHVIVISHPNFKGITFEIVKHG